MTHCYIVQTASHSNTVSNFHLLIFVNNVSQATLHLRIALSGLFVFLYHDIILSAHTVCKASVGCLFFKIIQKQMTLMKRTYCTCFDGNNVMKYSQLNIVTEIYKWDCLKKESCYLKKKITVLIKGVSFQFLAFLFQLI